MASVASRLSWSLGHIRAVSRTSTLTASFLLAAVLVGGVASTFWFGYRATREWERSTQQTVQARGREILALLAVAIDQDMKGAQLHALMPINQVVLERSSLYDIADLCAAAFARFPYIESVYVWHQAEQETHVFNRSERMPAWDHQSADGGSYPVVVRTDPVAVRHLVQATRSGAQDGSPYALVHGQIDGTPYQTLAHRIYDDDGDLAAVVGLLVNLDWVRQYYFKDLLEQVQRITAESSVRLEVVDDDGVTVAAVGPLLSSASRAERPFPLVFSDRSLAHGADDVPSRAWSARVYAAPDDTLVLGRIGYQRMLLMLAVGAGTAMIALLLTARAVRASATLAARQSEFVSAVSHEMKTPLSLITLASDSLAAGRCSTPEGTREYGRLLAVEARQLESLIDNVLCYARIVDQAGTLSCEGVDVIELVVASIERFRTRCAEAGCEIHLEVASGTGSVQGDRRMLQSLVDNIIDNALKYGATGGTIDIVLTRDEQLLSLQVTDRGEGIPKQELPYVFDKFHRGDRATHRFRGSGLGLTLARRIITAHQGEISIQSEVGRGTTVTVTLPSTSPA